jgi:hypothetical protein
MTEPADQTRAIDRWADWVRELADHPLDQYEYLGLLQQRDVVATWLALTAESVAAQCRFARQCGVVLRYGMMAW